MQKYLHFQTLKISENTKHSNYETGILPILNIQNQMARKSGYDIFPAKIGIKKVSLKKIKTS